MPTIKEDELEHEEFDYCTICGEYEGVIFLCGEGMICSPCFSREADVDEADVLLDNISAEDRDKARLNIQGE